MIVNLIKNVKNEYLFNRKYFVASTVAVGIT